MTTDLPSGVNVAALCSDVLRDLGTQHRVESKVEEGSSNDLPTMRPALGGTYLLARGFGGLALGAGSACGLAGIGIQCLPHGLAAESCDADQVGLDTARVEGFAEAFVSASHGAFAVGFVVGDDLADFVVGLGHALIIPPEIGLIELGPTCLT